MLIAIAGMTAYGVALFSYIVNRSADHIIPYVCLPAIALGALWLELLGGLGSACPPPASRAALGIALSLSTLLVAVAWSSVDTRLRAVDAGPRRARWPVADGRPRRPPGSAPAASGGRRGRAAARRARARGGPQHRAHQRRPVGRDPAAGGARQPRAARGPLGGQLRAGAAPRARSAGSSTTLSAGDRVLLDAAGRARPSTATASGRPSTPSPTRARPPSSRAAWPHCRRWSSATSGCASTSARWPARRAGSRSSSWCRGRLAIGPSSASRASMYTVPARRRAISTTAATAATGAQQHAGGDGRQALAGGLVDPAGALAPQGLVQVGLAGQQAHQALQPADQDLPAPDERGVLHPEAAVREAAAEGCASRGGPGGAACRGAASDRRTARAWRLSVFGTAMTTTPPGSSRRAAWRIASPGSGRCSSECQNTTAAHSPLTSARGSSLRSARVGLRSIPVASRPRARRASISVPSPAPTSSTGPAGAISSIRAACRPRVRPRIASAAK